jgi:hypothetical protein
MDLVWIALGICAVVGFVFYVLAQYWQRLLSHHTRALRDLTDRVQALEAMEDPEFRRKIGDSAPSPLEQVFTFSFRLSERFWRETLRASPEEIAFVKAYGKFVGSVKIEHWRSHSVVTVFEVLPQSKSAEWESRSIDVYSGSGADRDQPVALWDLPLAPNANYAPEAAPALELRLVENALELRAMHGRFGSGQENGAAAQAAEHVFFFVPLDAAQLADYRRSDADDPTESAEPAPAAQTRSSWIAYFAHQDERQGVDWQLCIRDLGRKEEWERWKIWEPWEVR